MEERWKLNRCEITCSRNEMEILSSVCGSFGCGEFVRNDCNFYFVLSESLISYENTGFKSVISQHTHTFWLFPLSHPLTPPHSLCLPLYLSHFSLISHFFHHILHVIARERLANV